MPESDTLNDFVRAVGRYLDAHGLLPPNAAVVVGVSGGADSVALLAALRELAGAGGRGYRLTAAHLNHALRADADDDERFVAELARGWSVAFVSGRIDVTAEAHLRGESIEQAARRSRYEFLLVAAREAGARFVAVGHHADDNAETILYRILRGTHVRGLAGMPPRRPLGTSDVMLVRPLLAVTRDRVEAFCRHAGLQWRTDKTNADTRYRRNFIRHELLPLIRSRLNPRADDALLRLATAAEDVQGLLDDLAADLLSRAERPSDARQVVLAADVLAEAPPVVRASAMRMAAERIGLPMRNMGAERLDELSDLAAGAAPAAALPGGYIARRQGGEVVIEPPPGPAAEVAGTIPLACPGETALSDGRRILCRVEPFEPAAFESHRRRRPEGEEMLDADSLRGKLTCRPRTEGDVFRPLGSPGRQSVSDFLTNRKLPAADRRRVLCICDYLGIVYVAPLRIDERVRVAEDTERIVRITVAPPAAQPGHLAKDQREATGARSQPFTGRKHRKSRLSEDGDP